MPDVKPSFVLYCAAVCLLSDVRLLLTVLLAALIHEACHAIAIVLCRGRIRAVTLNCCGAVMECSSLSLKGELISALSGPLGSIIASVIASGLGFYEFSGVSLTLGAFNLIPVYPLDGGRAVSDVLMLLCGRELAERISIAVSISSLSLLSAVSVLCLVRFHMPAAVIACASLIIAYSASV